MKNHQFIYLTFTSVLGLFILLYLTKSNIFHPVVTLSKPADYLRRTGCTCSRYRLPTLEYSLTNQNETYRSPLCSRYATQRGPHQRIISISLFGPQENKMFQMNLSLQLLDQLINDVNQIYSDGFILRIHHDNTINLTDTICPIECKHPNVDFCNMSHYSYIPPKIWRFLPAGDPFVDIMMSRDLDSALTKRERAAVNAWLSSNKSFHSMRDNPMHGVPMLGGMWGFRPSLNRSLSSLILSHILNENLVKRYNGRGDQTFLSHHVWPHARASAIAHDSFLCTHSFGHKPDPFPTQRSSPNETNCFVGCVRPCCGHGKQPFGPCPQECRPKDHLDWFYC